ncbi:MAG: hypothetical protein LBH93_03375 [Chitinispirillales bacterium]|jgi:hypothetical protein|nr:hypothetical protein [Chitinispirillales bacterium]
MAKKQTLILLLFAAPLLTIPGAARADDTLFHVYSRAAPQSVVSRSFAGAGSAVPHDVFQGLVNPALTAVGLGISGAYSAGYGRDAVFDKLALPLGIVFLENNGAMGLYYRYLEGGRGAVHDAVLNFAGRLSDQVDNEGMGAIDFGANIRYESSSWRHTLYERSEPEPEEHGGGAAVDTVGVKARAGSLLFDVGFYQRYHRQFDFSLVISNATGYRWSEAGGRGKTSGWIDARHCAVTAGMLYTLPIAGSALLRIPVDVEGKNLFKRALRNAYTLRAGAEAHIAQAYSVRFGYAYAPEDPVELVTGVDYKNLFFGGVGVAVRGALLDVFAGKEEFGASATYRY